LNPLPNGYRDTKIKFINNSTGFVFNDHVDLFKTSDRGVTWNMVANFPGATSMDIADSNLVVAGYSGQVYISNDNGTSWQRTDPGTSDKIELISIVSRDTIFLSGYNGKIYRTTDRGKTWVTLSPGGNSIQSFSFVNSQIGYVGSRGSIFKTTNGGDTWQTVNHVNYSSSDITAMQFLDKDTGFAFREWDSLLITYDGGITWKGSPATFGFTMNTMYFFNAATGYMGGDDGVMYKTIDSGKSWQSVTNLKAYGDVNDITSLYFFSPDSGFAVGGTGRIQHTTDGGKTWSEYATTYHGFTGMSFGNDSTGYACTSDQVYKTIDQGKTWKLLDLTSGFPHGNYGGFQKVHFINADTGFVTTPFYIHRTFDGGKTWDEISPNMYGFDNVYDLQFINKLTGYMATIYSNSQSTILKTKDGGLTWNIEWNARYQGELFTKIFYLNEAKGFAIRYDKLYMTLDSSKTWKPVLTGYNNYWLTSMWFVNDQKGFLAGEQGLLYQTNDGGQTWKQAPYIDSYLRDFYWIKFLNENVGYLYDGDIFKTYDGGASWHKDGEATNGLLASIEFVGDSTAIVYGGLGNILSSVVKGAGFDSLQLVSNAGCSATVSANIYAAFTEIDSLSFELKNTANGKMISVPASPDMVRNGSEKCIARFNDLEANSYNVRLKYWYNNEWQYSSSLSFNGVAYPAPYIRLDSTNVLVSSSSFGNQWYFNGSPIPGGDAQQYIPKETGQYSAVVSQDGCSSDMSYPVDFVAENLGIRSYPNPCHDYLYLFETQNRVFRYEILDISGTLMATGSLVYNSARIDVRNLKPGEYFIRLTDKKTNEKTTITFIKI
jgi:photosystem II stability/assembly factor-like uncharacterized protein